MACELYLHKGVTFKTDEGGQERQKEKNQWEWETKGKREGLLCKLE